MITAFTRLNALQPKLYMLYRPRGAQGRSYLPGLRRSVIMRRRYCIAGENRVCHCECRRADPQASPLLRSGRV